MTQPDLFDPAPAAVSPDLRAYDLIVINSSGGKDSQTLLRRVVAAADAAGVDRARLIVVHADLGEMEWKGTRALAEQQAAHYGLRFEAISRPQDLLAHIEERGMFPDSGNRFCTSDHKRDQIAKLFTRFVAERFAGRAVRILNCLGMRADESPARSKLAPFSENKRATNGKRLVQDWLAIHAMTTAEVWADIRESGVPHHPAYDLGMPRLSCVFCIFAPRPALLLAGKHNPDLLARYVTVEKKIGHTFRHRQSLTEIQEALAKGEEPAAVASWIM